MVKSEDWRRKKLHGEYHRQIEEVTDLEMSYRCLVTSGFNDNTKALIMAPQEQALNTQSIQASMRTVDANCANSRHQRECST